ncbi:hypothetical protein KR018_000312, partial [Drosophila ironensis]
HSHSRSALQGEAASAEERDQCHCKGVQGRRTGGSRAAEHAAGSSGAWRLSRGCAPGALPERGACGPPSGLGAGGRRGAA